MFEKRDGGKLVNNSGILIKYLLDHFPKCKQTLEKQSFSLKSFAFANILRWRIFYVEINGAVDEGRRGSHPPYT